MYTISGGGGGTSADIVPTQIIFGVDPCTRCWDIAQKPPKCKNFPLTPIVTKISFASFSARRGPPTPKLPRSRPWCLLYPEPKFHADRTILRWDILNRTKTANLISRQTLRCMASTNYTLSILSSKVNVASGLLLIVPGLPGPTKFVEKRDDKITLDARLHVFTGDSTNEPRVVRIFPRESCSCPARTSCYHITAARLAVGLSDSGRPTRRPLNLTRRNK